MKIYAKMDEFVELSGTNKFLRNFRQKINRNVDEMLRIFLFEAVQQSEILVELEKC